MKSWWLVPRLVREVFACIGIALFLDIFVLRNVVLFNPTIKLMVCLFIAFVIAGVLFIIEYHLHTKQISAEVAAWTKSIDQLAEEADESMRQ